MTTITCCYGCQKRTIGCHSTCEDYINDKKRYEEDKRKFEEMKQTCNDCISSAKTVNRYGHKNGFSYGKNYTYNKKSTFT